MLIPGCPAIFLGLVSHAFPLQVAGTLHIWGRLVAAFFLGFTVIALIRSVVAARSVTSETISAPRAGYLIIGVARTDMYCVLELTSPGSLAVASPSADQLNDVTQQQAILEYFSFVTLATLGYGDVTPACSPARSLACREAICGQFYLAGRQPRWNARQTAQAAVVPRSHTGRATRDSAKPGSRR